MGTQGTGNRASCAWAGQDDLQSPAVAGHRVPSRAVACHPLPSRAVACHPLPSHAIACHRVPARAIAGPSQGHRRPSQGHRRPSQAIAMPSPCHRRPSRAVGCHRLAGAVAGDGLPPRGGGGLLQLVWQLGHSLQPPRHVTWIRRDPTLFRPLHERFQFVYSNVGRTMV